MGNNRVAAVREALHGRFRRTAIAEQSRRRTPPEEQPPVSELPDVDREYRQSAAVSRNVVLFVASPKKTAMLSGS